jgi:hypothetical protein
MGKKRGCLQEIGIIDSKNNQVKLINIASEEKECLI